MESNSFINQATKKKSNYINSVQYELYLILKLVVVLIKYIYKKWIKLLINRIENHAYTSACDIFGCKENQPWNGSKK